MESRVILRGHTGYWQGICSLSPAIFPLLFLLYFFFGSISLIEREYIKVAVFFYFLSTYFHFTTYSFLHITWLLIQKNEYLLVILISRTHLKYCQGQKWHFNLVEFCFFGLIKLKTTTESWKFVQNAFRNMSYINCLRGLWPNVRRQGYTYVTAKMRWSRVQLWPPPIC